MKRPETTATAHPGPTPAWPLGQPLPVELAGSGQGWLARYRHWPVYSPAWVRGRLLTLTLPLTVLFVLLLAGGWPDDPALRPYGQVTALGLHLLMPMLAGPWLASLVRRRGWAAEREWRALWAAMALVIAAQFAFNAWAAKPLKQRIAEAAGQVDEQGRRKPVMLIIGVTVRSASPRPEADAPPMPPDPIGRTLNSVGGARLTFLLAGGAGLAALRREHAGLAALAVSQAYAWRFRPM